MICRDHQCDLIQKVTQYGIRWSCPHEGCTVCCWGGSTSTPADAETRGLRQQAHKLFDELWHGKKRSRTDAYRWLQLFMGLPKDEAHIGHFTKEQCAKLIARLEKKQ